MPMNTSRNRITGPYKDPVRETAFNQEYGLRAKVTFTNVNDNDWNWIEVTARFQSPKNKKYVIVEKYKPGKDNSTDHCIVCWEKNNKPMERRFSKYVNAELFLANLMSEE